jgi:hypothetical protein
MKKATRQFLKARPNAGFVRVEEIQVEGALPNHCFQNAANLAKTNEDLMIISGWMVGDYFGERGTAIIPHYWVCNEKTNNHYDPTPKPEKNIQTFEYVEDFDIFKFGTKDLYLPLSLKLLADGKWQARNQMGTGYIDLNKIDVEQLYKLRNNYTSSTALRNMLSLASM